MSDAVKIIKIIGCWFCIVAAVAFLIIGHGAPLLPATLFVGSLAFSHAIS